MENNNHKENEENKYEGMTEQEYLAGEPQMNIEAENKIESVSNEYLDDLSSGFMSEEDLGNDLNMFFIPSYKLNVDGIIDAFVYEASNCKTKSQLKILMLELWSEAQRHGEMTEKIERFRMEAEIMQAEMEAYQNGMEIEIQYLDINDENFGFDDFREED